MELKKTHIFLIIFGVLMVIIFQNILAWLILLIGLFLLVKFNLKLKYSKSADSSNLGIKSNSIKNNKLDHIKKIEKNHNDKILKYGEQYYFSDEAKINGKKVYQSKKEYIKNNPTDFETIGADLFSTFLHMVDDESNEDKQIYRLMGEGKYNEDNENYERAILLYEQANNLFFKVHGNELKELERINGCKCGEQITEQRLRICKNKLNRQNAKLLEIEAKELENTDPERAIELYQELNRLKPGLKKYNKRIKICKNKLR